MKLLRFFTSKHFLPILIVLFFGILASRTLLFQPGYFNMHDDLQIMRQLEMEKCVLEGQIPCRWVPDMGYGYGFPLFNFYPPLPYIVGEVYRLVGFSFVDTAKLLFATSIILSGIFMYLFAKEYFGKFGGIVSAVFYMWAPYHAVDIYVRGAMNESWALVFFPLICWGAYRLIKNKEKRMNRGWILNQVQDDRSWIIVLALAYFGLFTSHNLMLMIFTPVFAIWTLITLWQHSSWRKTPSLLIAGVWAFGLAAFFTIPALLENGYTQVEGAITGYFEYVAHFSTINQILFSRFWGYGGSIWLENDGMSFQVGYVYWIGTLVVVLLLLMRLFVIARERSDRGDLLKPNSRGIERLLRHARNDNVFLVSLFFILIGWFAAFLTHSKSIFFWQHIPQLAYLQFPWRFLALVIFSFSFAIGAVPGILADWKSHRGWFARFTVTYPQILIVILLSLTAVVYSWNYFLPMNGKMGALTDEEKLSGEAWRLQKNAGILDYLPKTVKIPPTEPQTVLAELIDGDGAISGSDVGTYWGIFNAQIETDTALVRINIFDFPNWKVYMDGREITHFIPDDEEWGRMYIVVPQGKHQVYAQLLNTPVRTASNIISFVSWGLLFGVWMFYRPMKKADTETSSA